MSFSSPGFLFAFLPVVFLVYYGIPAAIRNAWLLIASLAFYSIDGAGITWVLVASIIANQFLGLWISRSIDAAARYNWLVFGVVLNLVPLIFYKYSNFLGEGLHTALGFLQTFDEPFKSFEIVLPAGISFFTFQGISYLVDIYRREIAPAPAGSVAFGMYHSLFPQLIAGPIVRYVEIANEIYRRKITLADIESGILRFCIGLGKKIIIADGMGVVADHMFALPQDQLTTSGAWIGALCYTLQIFFDFSGYSDMAIGLGRMLGFHFPENFNAPYRSFSITEFWRRWHMTLSRWFRDYVYIPLGGNRAGPWRTYFNLFVVFAFCGLWHGAAITFLVWGCYHGILLVIERIALQNGVSWFLPAAARWPLTMLLVIIGWVIFRAPDMTHAATFLGAMAGLGASAPIINALVVVTPDKQIFFAIGVVLAVLPSGWAATIIRQRPIQQAFALATLAYSSVIIAANGFNPFIYFRF